MNKMRGATMWQCVKCETVIDDQHSFCWNCGTKRTAPPQRKPQPQSQSAVPSFASFEQLAPEPETHRALFTRGPHIRLLSYLLLGILVVIAKIVSSRFFGSYGLYIFVGVALLALIVILWRSFRRDKTEGVGLDLH